MSTSTALAGLHVFERGWLSSNNVLIPGEDGEGAALVDTGHGLHAAQTVALLRQALAGEPLVRVFIDVASTGEGWCPYCGTVYKLKPGEHAHHHTH